MSLSVAKSKYTGDLMLNGVGTRRAMYNGDPGLFGDIFGGIKSIVKTGLGVATALPGVGGFAGLARRTLFPGDARVMIPGASTLPSLPGGIYMPRFPTAGPGQIPIGIMPNGAQIPSPGIRGFLERGFAGGETGYEQDPSAMRAGIPAVTGYHWNKTGYFLKDGTWVGPGTRMVKNRRMNPCNPRAVSRSIARVKSAKRFAKSISNISIRKKC